MSKSPAGVVETVKNTAGDVLKTVGEFLGIGVGAVSAVAPLGAPVALAPLAPLSGIPASLPGAAASGGFALGAAAGLAPLIFIALIANAWGVFDPWDPNAGFQIMRGYDGNLYKVPDAIFDQVAREGNDSAFVSWIERQKKNIEDQQAAALAQQIADAAGITIAQAIKQGTALKVYGNSGTQKN